jgi:hypothetical protein
MSSNAALSAARRRRVGQPQVQQQPVSQQPTQSRTQQQPRNMMTPVDILKQHHNDISKIKERLDIVEKTNNDDNKDEENKDLYTKIMTEVNRNIDTKFKNNMKSEIDNTINGKINDIIDQHIEKRINFHVFQENLDTLSYELEKMQSLLNSQQININNLNNTQMSVMNKMAINTESNVDSSANIQQLSPSTEKKDEQMKSNE